MKDDLIKEIILKASNDTLKEIDEDMKIVDSCIGVLLRKNNGKHNPLIDDLTLEYVSMRKDKDSILNIIELKEDPYKSPICEKLLREALNRYNCLIDKINSVIYKADNERVLKNLNEIKEDYIQARDNIKEIIGRGEINVNSND